MADDLTVKSPGAGATGEARPKVDVAESDAAQAVDKLRALVKRRFGAAITQETAEALRASLKVKRARIAALTQTKAAYETTQAKERVGQQDGEVKARQVLGAAPARGADGLDEKAKAAVRGDPNASPQLPPSNARAPDAKLAGQIIDKMLRHVLVDDKPVDIAAYAAALRGTKTPQGKQAASSAERAAALLVKYRAGQSEPAPRLAQSGVCAPTDPLARSAPPRLAAPGFVVPQPRPSQQAPKSDGGGRLQSDTLFDGMRFNWSAFFLRFMIESTEDLAIWQRMMRALRQKAADNSLLARRAELVGMERNQEFEVLQSQLEFTKAFLSVAPAFTDGKRNAESRMNTAETAKAAEREAEKLAEVSEVEPADIKAKLPEAKKHAREAEANAKFTEERLEKAKKDLEEKKAKLTEAEEKGDEAAIAKLTAEVEEADSELVLSKEASEVCGKEHKTAQRDLELLKLKKKRAEVAERYKAAAKESRIAAQDNVRALADSDTAGMAGYANDEAMIASAKAKKLRAELLEIDLKLHAAEAPKEGSPAYEAWQEELVSRHSESSRAAAEAEAAEAQAPKEPRYNVAAPTDFGSLGKVMRELTTRSSSSIRSHLGTADEHYMQAHNEAVQRAIASPDETRRRVEQLKRRTIAEAQGMLDQLMAVYKSGRVV